MVGQQSGAGADIEHAFARPDAEVRHELLAQFELPGCADAIVIARQFIGIEIELRRTGNHPIVQSRHHHAPPPKSTSCWAIIERWRWIAYCPTRIRGLQSCGPVRSTIPASPSASSWRAPAAGCSLSA